MRCTTHHAPSPQQGPLISSSGDHGSVHVSVPLWCFAKSCQIEAHGGPSGEDFVAEAMRGWLALLSSSVHPHLALQSIVAWIFLSQGSASLQWRAGVAPSCFEDENSSAPAPRERPGLLSPRVAVETGHEAEQATP
jgi:hypothetical protein